MNDRLLLRAFFILAIFLLPQHIGAQSPPTVPASPPPGSTPPPTPPPVPPATGPKEGYVKVGGTVKPSRGRVTDIDKGDNGCYLTISDEKKSEYIEVGSFALCTQKPPLKGKRVEVEYSMETIMAGDCYGDPKCKRTETVPYVTSVKIVE